MSFEAYRKTIESPALQAIVDHWNAARGMAQMPSWEQLRPSDMAQQLSIIWVYKYDRASGQFTGRLAGSLITRGFKKNFRGLALQDAYPAKIFAWVHAAMSRIVCEPAFHRGSGNLFRHRDNIVEGERIMLPLAMDGVHADGVLGASCYSYPLLNRENCPVEILSDRQEWFCVLPRCADAGPAEERRHSA